MTHRPIPVLRPCPRVKSIANNLHRSYPTGRQEFSRAYCGSAIELSIFTTDQFPAGVRASLMTTLNAERPGEWIEIPFERSDEKTFACRVVPGRPGLYSYWARFSLDGGATWIHDPVPDAWVLVDPPQVDQLRLYTMIPNVSGTIADWSAELPRIKAMGFNAVHLLPLTTLDTSRSPYAARDLFDVDSSYLDAGSAKTGLEQLEEFIETARTLEMRLCFDLVLNHVGSESKIVKQAPEWIVPDHSSPDGLRRARYWSDKGWLPWNDLVLIDYEHPSQRIRADIWAYMTEYALFWAKYASETGGFVRFDNLHSSDKKFLDSVTKILHDEYPNVAIIAEYFTDASTLLNTVPAWGLNLILATPWDNRFVPQLRDYLRYIHSIGEHVRFYMPITSHDSGSPAQEFGAIESTVPRYVAAALLGTGATGITQGVEWGDKQRINFIGIQPKMIRTGEPMFGDFLKKVNEILVAEPAFRRGENCQFVDNNHHAVIAAFRRDSRPGKIGFLVICNFDILNEHAFEADLSKIPGMRSTGRCVDLLTGKDYSITAAKVSLTLKVCAAHVLVF
ncbi:MAG TPA: alpha-amylase family glycosyl hydrolase [Tepidisphaeraceae bacterium]|nr:alpha-amylase family glycosyl hydrolase [Tepidisphaeraceae bacterium]